MPVKISPGDPIYLYLMKHYCPKCSGKMRPYWTNSVVYSDDPSADPAEFDYVESGYPYGDVSIRHWVELKCKTCGYQMTEKQLREWEKHNKTK